MSREEQRRRIPTSDELESQGALTPATGEPRTERRSLLRFFRASRFRVSDDVAARKHVGTSQPKRSPNTPTSLAEAGGGVEHQPERAAAPRPTMTPAARPKAGTIVPRAIRIDPSVKQRRGLARPGSHQRPSR